MSAQQAGLDSATHVGAGYIWNNPVKAGLVANREAYSFSGPREVMGFDSKSDRPEGLSLLDSGAEIEAS